MLALKFDATGKLVIDFGLTDAEIISLGNAFIEQETRQLPAQQLKAPDLMLIRAARDEALSAAEQAQTNENLRAVSTAAFDNALTAAKVDLKEAIIELKHKHRKNRAILRDWGLVTVEGVDVNVRVKTPTSDRGWADLIHAYVIKEQSLPEAERLVEPSLARLIDLDAIIQTNLAQRATGTTERGIGVKGRLKAVTRLLDLLQAAAVVLVVTRYDGCVSEELTRWGYKVLDKRALPTEPAVEPEPVA